MGADVVGGCGDLLLVVVGEFLGDLFLLRLLLLLILLQGVDRVGVEVEVEEQRSERKDHLACAEQRRSRGRRRRGGRGGNRLCRTGCSEKGRWRRKGGWWSH